MVGLEKARLSFIPIDLRGAPPALLSLKALPALLRSSNKTLTSLSVSVMGGTSMRREEVRQLNDQILDSLKENHSLETLRLCPLEESGDLTFKYRCKLYCFRNRIAKTAVDRLPVAGLMPLMLHAIQKEMNDDFNRLSAAQSEREQAAFEAFKLEGIFQCLQELAPLALVREVSGTKRPRTSY